MLKFAECDGISLMVVKLLRLQNPLHIVQCEGKFSLFQFYAQQLKCINSEASNPQGFSDRTSLLEQKIEEAEANSGLMQRSQ